MRTMNNIKNETSTSSLYFLYIIVCLKSTKTVTQQMIIKYVVLAVSIL
jgi:hypothetical protein